jgi:peroxiredoxin
MTGRSIRWFAVAALALTSVAGARADETTAALAIGKSAPKADVKMANVDGKSISIAEAKGPKGTLVVFTCNSCPYAQAWQSRIAELGNTYSKQGVGVIAINANDPGVSPKDDMAGMKDRAKLLSLEFPYVMDASSDVARAFGATRTPEAFLFDAKGKLVYHGAIDDNGREPDKVTARWLNDALVATVAGKTVAVQETKSIGCGIKFRGKGSAS